MFYEHKMPYGPIVLQRRDLCEMLVEKTNQKTCSIHYSKKLVKYDSTGADGQFKLHFDDGTTASADLIIGADGIHSTVRKFFFSDLASATSDEAKKEQYLRCIEPRWSGTYMYRTNMGIPKEKIQELNPEHPSLKVLSTIWCGKDKHGLTIDQGKMITFSVYHSIPSAQGSIREGSRTEDVDKQEVADALAGWEPALQQILHLHDPDVQYSRWAIHCVEPIPQSVSGNVILIGDAAHAMTPHQGVGGGQAVEDSHLLGRILAHPSTTKQSLKHALQVYQQIRLPFAKIAAQRSLFNGMMYEFNHPDYFYEAGRPPSKDELVRLGKAIEESFKWLGQGGCYDDWDEAERKLLEQDIGA
ncbi:hypothetical protein E1B28_012084 [Marasmius oreades]|uniref:FAD-binding domain-containing protein n=1 Tax=Marasmius oreades TaxID=181124 RepID=A0A9P7RQX5_9AGAR|nr:uncharacterized protein E1B28_012084 [Marasmius oreades]KAG7088050.1 hypothetical protein E1B28_012084 [Marasmius oreades]